MEDRFDLQRFINAQEGLYDQALAELRGGRKRSHWMWFVFPQIAGLGHSATAQRFAISGSAEARAYLDHPVLGPRLRACCDALLDLPETDPATVLGEIDALKLRSSMTLFMSVELGEPRFARVLERYYAGRPDGATERLLASGG